MVFDLVSISGGVLDLDFSSSQTLLNVEVLFTNVLKMKDETFHLRYVMHYEFPKSVRYGTSTTQVRMFNMDGHPALPEGQYLVW